jgi:hypothetical protein
MTGKSNLLLERRNSGAASMGTIWIRGFETMSGWISDSANSQHVVLLPYLVLPTSVAN